MGDRRFDPLYDRIVDAADRSAAIRALTDVQVIQALAAASRAADPLVANLLATEAENRMRHAGLAAAQAPECILSLDAEGRVTYANLAAARLLACPSDQLLGRAVWEAVDVFAPDGARLPREHRPSFIALRERRESRGEVDVRCANGERIPCLYMAAPVVREGEVEGAVVVFHRRAPQGRPPAA